MYSRYQIDVRIPGTLKLYTAVITRYTAVLPWQSFELDRLVDHQLCKLRDVTCPREGYRPVDEATG